MTWGGGKPLNCVFFSLISREKGVDVLLEAIKSCSQAVFSFYGNIEEGYKVDFERIVNSLSNAEYRGIFTGSDEAKYQLLSEYDVMLLPTRWAAEGIPGIIVESRIAGIVPIVTNHNFNSELVNDEYDGMLINNLYSHEELIKKIHQIDDDRKLYDRLRRNSIKRAEQYYIENYIGDIISDLI